MTNLRIYSLDVGVYARAPLLEDRVRRLLGGGGACIVTRAVLDSFDHRLRASARSFKERYSEIKSMVYSALSRHMARGSVYRMLALLEKMRQGREDSFLYTVMLSLLSEKASRYRGKVAIFIADSLQNVRHLVALLDALYSLLSARMETIVNSVESTLRSYVENGLGCRVGLGPRLQNLLPVATRISGQLRKRRPGKVDEEDIAIILSLCSLTQHASDEVVLVTSDYKASGLVDALVANNDVLMLAGLDPGCVTRIKVEYLV